MTAAAFCKRVTPSLVIVTLVGLLVVGVAWVLAGQGSEAVRVATGGVVSGWLIVLAAEMAVVSLGAVTGNEVAPVFRMLLTMLVRGGGAMIAVAIGVVAMQYEPRTVAYVALAMYASLVTSEVLEAMALLRATPLPATNTQLNDAAMTTERAS